MAAASAGSLPVQPQQHAGNPSGPALTCDGSPRVVQQQSVAQARPLPTRQLIGKAAGGESSGEGLSAATTASQVQQAAHHNNPSQQIVLPENQQGNSSSSGGQFPQPNLVTGWKRVISTNGEVVYLR